MQPALELIARLLFCKDCVTRRIAMRSLIRIITVLAATTVAFPANAILRLSASGEAREEINTAAFVDRYSTLANYLGHAAATGVQFSFNRDLTRELQRTRTGSFDVIVGPAHVIGSAIRYGYEPVARFQSEESVVFIASDASGVTSLDNARGKRIALPPSDSLATYLARGELNAKGVHSKAFFSEIREYRYHEAALLALEFGQADLAVVDKKMGEEWLSRNKGRILFESKTAPGMGVAMLGTLDKTIKDRIRVALLSPSQKLLSGAKVASLDLPRMQPISSQEYAYVSTLGYFTPNALDGVKRVAAEDVVELTKNGVPLFDTRIPEEYVERHIKGAINVPYMEKSAKDVGFDASQDRFDLSRLPSDKSAPLIFACNGAECWKSYKASVTAIHAGYKQIYWFRGGFPEWRGKDLPTE
jgi:ABC-type phosphate/phosphonate transport system substrate-binding protein/rhodanese-related sulfurtransferase